MNPNQIPKVREYRLNKIWDKYALPITLFSAVGMIAIILFTPKVAEMEKEMDFESEYRQSITASYGKLETICGEFNGKVVLLKDKIVCE